MMARALTRLRDPRLVDPLIAVGFAILVVAELLAHMDDGYRAGDAAWNTPILLGTVAALAWRRRSTGWALIAGYAFALIPSLFVAHTIFFFGTLIPLLVLTFTAAERLPTQRFAWSLLGPALLLVTVPLHQPGFDAGDVVFWVMLSAMAVGLGRLVRSLNQHRTALAATLADQVRDLDAREHALLTDERSRIARELHDVVAHGVSVMVVQAGAARLAVGFDDEEARTGILTVEDAGREALIDLRRLLGLLRPDTDEAAVQPTSGMAMLDELVTRMRASGLAVTVEVTGMPAPLPAGLDLSAYRIIQEALTNTLKHAGPTSVTVALHYGETLTLDIIDAGPAPGHVRRRTPVGHGIIGMRERAKLFGGTFSAGLDGNGWRMHVSVPRPVNQSTDPATTTT
jgi:signal transduction histidine kinase